MAKTQRITSPVGVAQYPWLNKADTAFNNVHGCYKVNLVVPKADATPFIEKVTAAFKEYNPKAKNFTKPWAIETDDQGNATGNIILRFKNQNREGWDRKPALYDAKLNATNVAVGPGSKLRVSTDLYFWSNEGKSGVTLQMAAVQIIELHERESRDSHGFEPTEGFVGDDNETPDLSEEGEDENLF